MTITNEMRAKLLAKEYGDKQGFQTFIADNGELMAGFIDYDECAENPRKGCDYHVAKLVFAPSYSHLCGWNDTVTHTTARNLTEHMGIILKELGLNEKTAYIYPITKYEHGMISLSLGDSRTCRFDSGIFGFAVLEKKHIREHFQVGRVTDKVLERALKSVENELEEFENYLNGKCYGAFISRVTDDLDFEFVDSCYGFYGDEWAIEYLNDDIIAPMKQEQVA